jgi:stress response protein YsnF
VILREEEPVVEKRVVPKERVRLDKETVTGQDRVEEELRKEQIEVHDEDTTGGRHERRQRR